LLQTETVMLTPVLAERMLANMVNQRRLNESAVESYAAEMRDGRWKQTHQGLALTATGKLLDGQHRCQAVVRSGVTIPILVTRGVDEESFSDMDRQRGRSNADILSIAGYDRSRLLAAMSKIIIQFYKGTVASNGPCSPTEALVFSDANKAELVYSADRAANQKQKAAMLGAAHFIFARINLQKADAFLEAVDKGTGLDAKNAAFVLRERLRGQAKGGHFASRDVLAWTLLAANAWFLERPLPGLPQSGKAENRYTVHPAVTFPNGIVPPAGIDLNPARKRELAAPGNPKEGLIYYRQRFKK
jgi:hypothetical protein